jgi:hypothetical protein
MRRPGIAAYCAVGEDSTFLRQRFRNGILHHGSPNKRNFAGAKTFSRPKKTGPVGRDGRHHSHPRSATGLYPAEIFILFCRLCRLTDSA